MDRLTVTSPCFGEGGLIPVEYTGYGGDRSPELVLRGLRDDAVTLAVVMNDMDHPIPAFNHWVIWNIPAMSVIPGDIPPGERVGAWERAAQGIGYGRHRYRGPKPPFHWSHRYQYNVYALDTFLDLPGHAKKRALLAAMRGHVLQQGVLTGHYR